MADYPVLDGEGNTVIANAYDPAWTVPDPYDYQGDYPVLDGNGDEIVSVPFDPALIPYGPERILNGGFDTDTAWSKGTGWVISGGVASFSGGTSSNLLQTNAVESGKRYLVAFDVTATNAGSIATVRIGSGGVVHYTIPLAIGSYTFECVADGTFAVFRAEAGRTLSIDNVSIREVI